MIYVDETLYSGAPLDDSNRQERELRTYRCLNDLGIEFCRVDHEPAMTIPDCEKIDRILGIPMCKNLFLCNRQKTDFYLLSMQGEKQFYTKELSHQIGTARLSFADAEHMEQFLDILPGAVSVLGLMNDTSTRVQLLIDEDLMRSKWIGCHPCVNTSSLRIRMSDLLEKFLPFTGHSYIPVHMTGSSV